mmetsp:Transcript_18362/g.33752  ORF Transcript_18362/g.33752 Transcript_18362/m.33752 type:complete len:340 (+) Transcript_18362:75-1094(+)
MCFAVISHVAWGHCEGKFFDAERDAVDYYKAQSMLKAHMVIDAHGKEVRYWGDRKGRDHEMRKWWQSNRSTAQLAPFSADAIVALQDSGRLHGFFPECEGSVKGAVLVLPGGGYATHDMGAEGFQTAEVLTSIGFAAFVLEYTLEPRDPITRRAKSVEPALEEALVALEIISKIMTEREINPEKLFVVGFSAGGHLTMCLCRRAAELGEEFAYLRPRGIVLGYPTIKNPLCPCIAGSVGRSNPLRFISSNAVSNLLHPVSSAHKWCDLHLRAAEHGLPSSLVVSSFEDGLLPPALSSDLLVNELRRQSIPVDYLCKNYGGHGFALKGWKEELVAWMLAQ